MGLRKVEYRPGVVVDDTDYASQGYAISSDQIRWVRGRAESLGGYEDFVGGQRVQGIGRSLHAWVSVKGLQYLAIGTHRKLYVVQDGALFDITPQRAAQTSTGGVATTAGSKTVSVTVPAHGLQSDDTAYLSADAVGGIQLGKSGAFPANSFYTGAGTATVLVSLPAHGMSAGDLITISGFTAFNGVNLNGTWSVAIADDDKLLIQSDTVPTASGSGGGTPTYKVAKQYQATVVTGDRFTVQVPTAATSTATGGGTVSLRADIRSGRKDGSGAGGYSSGGFGQGPFGLDPDPANKVAFRPRTWALANFGQTLLANPLGGSIYRWDLNLSKRAEIVANAPAVCDYMMVTPEHIVLAMGCTHVDGVYDPLTIRWSNINDIDTWFPASSNNAGDAVLSSGSAIVAAVETKNGVIVWTDTALFFGRYSAETIYSFDFIGGSCGLAGPEAFTEKDGSAYWYSPSGGFYMYDGGTPRQMPCPVRRYVVDAIDPNQHYKVVCAFDAAYEAVLWLYPHDAPEVNRYVRCDLRETGDPNAGWSVGTTDMTAWMDRAPLSDPISIRKDGLVARQDVGMSADGAPIARHIEYAPMEVPTEEGDGERVFNINRVVFDAEVRGTVEIRVRTRRWPNGPVVEKGPFAWRQDTQYIRTRAQGRQAGFRYDSTGLADFWRVGSCRYDVSPGPRR